MLRSRLPSTPVLVAVVAGLAALAGCGGDENGGERPAVGGAATEASAGGSARQAPTLDGVLRCLQAAGLPASRQSGLDDEEYVGIDGEGGRTVISFSRTKEDADLTASAAGSSGKVVREGLITTSLDDAVLDQEPVIRGCMRGEAAAGAASAAAEPDAEVAGGTATPAGADGGATVDVGRVAADFPTEQDVRSCLRGRGVPFRDEASTKTDGIEIVRRDGGLTTISFEENEGLAKAVEEASKEYGDAVRVGTVVASLATTGEPDAAAIRACLAE